MKEQVGKKKKKSKVEKGCFQQLNTDFLDRFFVDGKNLDEFFWPEKESEHTHLLSDEDIGKKKIKEDYAIKLFETLQALKDFMNKDDEYKKLYNAYAMAGWLKIYLDALKNNSPNDQASKDGTHQLLNEEVHKLLLSGTTGMTERSILADKTMRYVYVGLCTLGMGLALLECLVLLPVGSSLAAQTGGVVMSGLTEQNFSLAESSSWNVIDTICDLAIALGQGSLEKVVKPALSVLSAVTTLGGTAAGVAMYAVAAANHGMTSPYTQIVLAQAGGVIGLAFVVGNFCEAFNSYLEYNLAIKRRNTWLEELKQAILAYHDGRLKSQPDHGSDSPGSRPYGEFGNQIRALQKSQLSSVDFLLEARQLVKTWIKTSDPEDDPLNDAVIQNCLKGAAIEQAQVNNYWAVFCSNVVCGLAMSIGTACLLASGFGALAIPVYTYLVISCMNMASVCIRMKAAEKKDLAKLNEVLHLKEDTQIKDRYAISKNREEKTFSGAMKRTAKALFCGMRNLKDPVYQPVFSARTTKSPNTLKSP